MGSFTFSGLALASAIEGVANAGGGTGGSGVTTNSDGGVVMDRFQTDHDGETHFSKCRVPMSRDANGNVHSLGIASKDISFWDLPAGLDVPPHHAPERQFVVVLSGEIRVTVSDGESRSWRTGDVFLATDAGTGKGHRTQTIGGPARALFVPVGDDVDLDAWTVSAS